MKPTFPFLALILCAAPLPPLVAEPASPPPATRAEFASRLQHIAAQLDLSDAQKATIAPILEGEAAELRTLQADSALRRMQKLKRFREINRKASDQIRAELTPEQRKKYDALRAEAREEFKAKMAERRQAQGS